MSVPETTTSPLHAAPRTQEWWRTAVIYQIYPRSFASANADGIGDLPGITSRLPYLRDLGVDALWISPFYPSPQADAGYDVADYMDVDPLFGTLSDADQLIATAHDLGLRVFFDVVPNHTSDEHAWFQAALAAGPGSPERARYWFLDSADGPPNNWPSEFGGSAWTQVPDGQWYLRMFDRKQPDLNWSNPEVRAMFLDVLRFWLDRGVDGFRVDVAHALVKADGVPDFTGDLQAIFDGRVPAYTAPFYDQDGVHDIYRDWRKLLNTYPGERAMVAEAWVNPQKRLARYVRPDEFHQAFNFAFLQTPWNAADLRTCIVDSLRHNDAVGAPATWVLSNHDVIRPVSRFGYTYDHISPWLAAGEPDPDLTIGTRRLGPRRCSCWRCPAVPTSTKERSSACLRSSTCPTPPDRTRPSDPAAARSSAVMAAASRCRGSRASPATASATERRPGCLNPTPSATWPSTGRPDNPTRRSSSTDA
jgi:alpha-glucosidase